MVSTVFLSVLVLLLAAHVVASVQELRRDRRRDRVLMRVDQFLTVWAETWGDAPEHVKDQLLRILHEHEQG